MRRILPLLTLVALLLAPFGRMAAAEASAMPHHGDRAAAASGHCDGMPAQGEGRPDRAIDCMIACAALASAEAPTAAAAPALAPMPEPAAARQFSGIDPEADPPPPRFS